MGKLSTFAFLLILRLSSALCEYPSVDDKPESSSGTSCHHSIETATTLPLTQTAGLTKLHESRVSELNSTALEDDNTIITVETTVRLGALGIKLRSDTSLHRFLSREKSSDDMGFETNFPGAGVARKSPINKPLETVDHDNERSRNSNLVQAVHGQIPMLGTENEASRLVLPPSSTVTQPIEVMVPIPPSPNVRSWSKNITIVSGKIQLAPTLYKSSFGSTSFLHAQSTQIVCQNHASATATLLPSSSADGSLVAEMLFSKTDASSLCGNYPASISRCMRRYTTPYTSIVTENRSPSGNGQRSAKTIIVQGPHWGVSQPQSTKRLAIKGGCRADRGCYDLGCFDENSCVHACVATHDGELKFLYVLLAIFGISSVISIVGITTKLMHRRNDRERAEGI